MSFLHFIIIFVLAHTGAYLNNLLVSSVRIDFLFIFPLATLLLRKDWVSCIYFTFFGLVVDSYSTGFFGIHGLAYFLVALLIIQLAQDLLTDSALILILAAFFGSTLMHLLSAVLIFLAEGQNFLQASYLNILLLTALPSSLAFWPVYLICKRIMQGKYNRTIKRF